MLKMKSFPKYDKVGASPEVTQPQKAVAQSMMAAQNGFMGMPMAFGGRAMSRPFTQPPAASPTAQQVTPPPDAGTPVPMSETAETSMDGGAAPVPMDMAQPATPDTNALMQGLAQFAQLNTQPRQMVPPPVHPFNQQMADMVGLPTQRSTQPAAPPVHPFNQKMADLIGLPTTRSAQPQRRVDPLSRAFLSLGRR